MNNDNAENLISKIIEVIKSQKGLESVQVERDIHVEGRTASYPVDLYWEFKAGNGVTYKVIAQVKNVEKVLNKNELFQFANVLQDISGQVMGVIFTQPVYDKLVQDIAKDVGIMLYEMGNLQAQSMWQPNISDIKIDFDTEWIKTEKIKKGLEDAPISFSGDPKYMYIYDEQDFCIDSIEGIFNTYVKKYTEKEDFSEKRIGHSFENKVYLETGHELIPKVKINGVAFGLNFIQIPAWETKDIVVKIVNTAVSANLK